MGKTSACGGLAKLFIRVLNVAEPELFSTLLTLTVLCLMLTFREMETNH